MRYRLTNTPDVETYEKFGMYHVIKFQYDSKYAMYDVIAPVKILDKSLSRDSIKRIDKCIELFINITLAAGKGYNDEKEKKLGSELKVEESDTPKRKTKTKVQKGKKSNEKDN